MTRHEMREAAFILLFEMKIGKSTVDEAVEDSKDAFDLPVDKDVITLVTRVSEKIDEIDDIISKYSAKRAVARISNVPLVIMEIAIYEMKYSDNVPDVVAINEAIELTKAYGSPEDKNFVNGILNAYLKDKGGND